MLDAARSACDNSRMSEHPNAALVRRLFDAFRGRDVAAIVAAVPDDLVWHFPGRHGRLAGTHRGREGVLAFLASVSALTGDTFHLDLEDVAASDRHAVALFRGHGTREGKVLDNPTCLRMRIEDGRIAEVWEFVWDLYAVDDFWA
jgi:ketosteroid isomerase-like protein